MFRFEAAGELDDLETVSEQILSRLVTFENIGIYRRGRRRIPQGMRVFRRRHEWPAPLLTCQSRGFLAECRKVMIINHLRRLKVAVETEIIFDGTDSSGLESMGCRGCAA